MYNTQHNGYKNLKSKTRTYDLRGLIDQYNRLSFTTLGSNNCYKSHIIA